MRTASLQVLHSLYTNPIRCVHATLLGKLYIYAIGKIPTFHEYPYYYSYCELTNELLQ